jgi:hypothetical protein
MAGQAKRLLSVLETTRADLALEGGQAFFPLETVTGETRWLARFIGPGPADAARADERDLEALWTRAHVAGTNDREPDLGSRHRVLTPLTSILVLESAADYARWGIPAPGENVAREKEAQNAGLLGLLRRTDDPHLAPTLGRYGIVGNNASDHLADVIGRPIGEANVGGLGLVDIGTGGGGGGTGEGTVALGHLGTIGKGGGNGSEHSHRTLAGRRARAPGVVAGEASVRGKLDKEIIRRVIRLHINEVKYCYESELVLRPGLAGRLAVWFTIGASGQVLSSGLQSSSLNDVRVETCVLSAVRRWEFPKTAGGGIIIASCPFNFTGGDLAPTRRDGAPPVDFFWQGLADNMRGVSAPTDRAAKAAQAVGLFPDTQPAYLAWWLVENRLRHGGAPPLGYLVTANLLAEAGQHDDAIRILSEAGPIDPAAVAAELRLWREFDDANRVEHRTRPQ